MRTIRVGCVLALALAGACRQGTPDKPTRPGAKADPINADAETLGQQIFELADRASSYQVAHRGRYPKSVAELGIDSLTGTTARRFGLVDGALRVTVAYRRTANRQVSSCEAGVEVLEQASLNDGAYPLTCVGRDGQASVISVARSSR